MRPSSEVEKDAVASEFGASSLARILFLAVDAADRDLILTWAGEGVLPTFRSLLPAQHGRYCFSQLRTGTYEHSSGRSGLLSGRAKTAPSSRVNGIQIVDWGTHDPELGF